MYTLCYIILYYIILHYIILSCLVLCCVVLCCVVLCCVVLYCIVLYCIVLCCIIYSTWVHVYCIYRPWYIHISICIHTFFGTYITCVYIQPRIYRQYWSLWVIRHVYLTTSRWIGLAVCFFRNDQRKEELKRKEQEWSDLCATLLHHVFPKPWPTDRACKNGNQNGGKLC